MSDNKQTENDNAKQPPETRGVLPDAYSTLGEIRSNILDTLGRVHWPLWWPWAPIEPSAQEPETAVADTGGELKVTIDLPGVAKEDIELSVTNDSVELAAIKTEARAPPLGKYVSHERCCMSYKRVLALSEDIIPEQTNASFENGVLTLVLKRSHPNQHGSG